jgi:hypothetical protein
MPPMTFPNTRRSTRDLRSRLSTTKGYGTSNRDHPISIDGQDYNSPRSNLSRWSWIYWPTCFLLPSTTPGGGAALPARRCPTGEALLTSSIRISSTIPDYAMKESKRTGYEALTYGGGVTCPDYGERGNRRA